MARDEYDWIDDAFADDKPDPLDKGNSKNPADYDWIDDAFDDSKADPLAAKGMTGCSRLAVLLCVIGVVLIIGFVVIVGMNAIPLFATGASL